MYQSEITELRRKTLGWKKTRTISSDRLAKIVIDMNMANSDNAREFIEKNLVGKSLEYTGLIWNPFPFYRDKIMTVTSFDKEGRKFYRVKEIKK